MRLGRTISRLARGLLRLGRTLHPRHVALALARVLAHALDAGALATAAAGPEVLGCSRLGVLGQPPAFACHHPAVRRRRATYGSSATNSDWIHPPGPSGVTQTCFHVGSV